MSEYAARASLHKIKANKWWNKLSNLHSIHYKSNLLSMYLTNLLPANFYIRNKVTHVKVQDSLKQRKTTRKFYGVK